MTLTNLEYALHYAANWNWAVFPCHTIVDGGCTCGETDCASPGKHPLTANGSRSATTDEAQITAWWTQWPDANIAIASGSASKLAIVDVDVNKGGKIEDLFFGGIDKEYLASTPTVQSGAGWHFYFRLPEMPDGLTFKNSVSKWRDHIDTRGEGGYVIAPPSKHVSGAVYTFANDAEATRDFPDVWLKDFLEKTEAGKKTATAAAADDLNAYGGSGFVVPEPDPGLKVPDAIPQGKRNDTLIKLAGAMRHHGFSETAIHAALHYENQRLCIPPLPESEVNAIARSIGRYSPNVEPDMATDADSVDYENTLKPYLFGDLISAVFEKKEILSFHIGKKDIAIIQAATNAGKTTLLRNVALCMASGRPFPPFYDGGRPIKLAYFDFESDAQDVQRDLIQMYDVFGDVEKDLIRRNMIIIPKGLMGGELFQFNTHEKWANELIQRNHVEFIIVDNVSAAYDLNDENSNAEVTKKVIKPLLKMAAKGDCAFLFAHHYGKGKASEIEAAGVHAGRGASALQALSRTVINMFGDVSKGEPVTIECAKRKTDGGQNYREVFELKPDRWFHHTLIVPPPKKKTAYVALRDYLDPIRFPDYKTLAELIDAFEKDFEANSVKKTLNELYRDGFIERPQHGCYCGKDRTKTNGNGNRKAPVANAASNDSAPVKNWYEKDDF